MISILLSNMAFLTYSRLFAAHDKIGMMLRHYTSIAGLQYSRESVTKRPRLTTLHLAGFAYSPMDFAFYEDLGDQGA